MSAPADQSASPDTRPPNPGDSASPLPRMPDACALPPVPERISRYRVERVLGEGGFGHRLPGLGRRSCSDSLPSRCLIAGWSPGPKRPKPT